MCLSNKSHIKKENTTKELIKNLTTVVFSSYKHSGAKKYIFEFELPHKLNQVCELIQIQKYVFLPPK